MLENGNKQYTPWINCPNKKSDDEYAPSKEGTVSDLRINESYVEFKFLPEVLKTEESNLGPEETLWKDEIKYDKYKTLSSTTYYRYRDKLYEWDVTTKLYEGYRHEIHNYSDLKDEVEAGIVAFLDKALKYNLPIAYYPDNLKEDNYVRRSL